MYKQDYAQEVVTPTDIKAAMIAPVIQYATMLENIYHTKLIPPQPGVYKPGDMLPLFLPGVKYYTRKISANTATYEEIANIDSVVDDVYDEKGVLIAPKYVMENKNTLLTPHPTIPVRGLHLVKNIIDFDICRHQGWTTQTMARVALMRVMALFTTDSSEIIEVDSIVNNCSAVLQQIHGFINDEYWNYYYVRFFGLDIIVEKGPDYRVCAYYELLELLNKSQHQ